MKSKTVAIEIGHGQTPDGFDPGTMSYANRINEYELNKIAAFACQKRLAELDIESVIIDEPKSLFEIGKLSAGYACMVSIHHNSYDGKVQGVETFFERTVGDSEDEDLANSIQKEVLPYAKFNDPLNRGVKRQGLAVLKGAKSVGTVACLHECYFIDSLNIDVEKFKDRSLVCGKKIAEGICAWHRLKFRNAPANPGSSTYPYVPATLPLTDSYVEIVRALQGLGDAPKKSLSSAEYDHAVRVFQQKHSLAVDGDVGPKTLTALNLALSLARKNLKTTEPIVDIATLTRTDKKDTHGCYRLLLKIGDKEFYCLSGQPYAQNFRLPSDSRSVPGNMEPIPQGTYAIGDLEWVNGKDNYTGSHGPGLGPVKAALTATFKDDRGAFYIHIDSNSDTSWGTAGCVGIYDVSDMKLVVGALREFDPKYLIVSYGL